MSGTIVLTTPFIRTGEIITMEVDGKRLILEVIAIEETNENNY